MRTRWPRWLSATWQHVNIVAVDYRAGLMAAGLPEFRPLLLRPRSFAACAESQSMRQRGRRPSVFRREAHAPAREDICPVTGGRSATQPSRSPPETRAWSRAAEELGKGGEAAGEHRAWYLTAGLQILQICMGDDLLATGRQTPDFLGNGGLLRDGCPRYFFLKVFDFCAAMASSLDFFLSFAACHGRFLPVFLNAVFRTQAEHIPATKPQRGRGQTLKCICSMRGLQRQ